MALSAFDDKEHPPTDAQLVASLGRAHAAWMRLIKRVTAAFAGVTQVWGFTSRSTGWGLRLVAGKRVVLYLTPQDGCFLASLALGEKAVIAAKQAGLPAAIERIVDEAPRYAEGRGVRIALRAVKDVDAIERLAIAKMQI